MNVTIPYSRLQENLQWTCDRACREHESILVERGEGKNIVHVSEK
uniref:Antitoxin n=1 Tax=Candidatus Kentrum sp. FW TaxID=2126338 RepID=A0A450TCU8_9GAMM|nr:MAG: hypothetical protein BECKFW1821A_GA0114235_11786 [Candidatus Kentron sp. FW]